MANGRFAYDPGGRVFAIACGSEVLAHDGDSEAPTWRKDLGDEVAGVEMSGDEIVAVTAAGTIVRIAWKDGRELGRTDLARPVRALACGAGGWIAVAHDARVSLLRRGDLAPTKLHHDGVTALAFSGDASKLLLGTATGSVIEIAKPDREAEARTLATGSAAVTAIAWSAKGAWLVAAADRVLRLEPGGEPAHVTRAGGQTITDVAVSLDGRRFAIQIGDHVVAVLDDPPKETIAQLRYPERSVRGLRFGPGTWVGVALDTGDGNKLDYSTGALHRSDTHPGRQHTSWLVEVSTPALDEKPRAARAPSARSAPAPVAYDDPPPAPDGGEGPSPLLIIRLVLAVVFVLLALIRLMSH